MLLEKLQKVYKSCRWNVGKIIEKQPQEIYFSKFVDCTLISFVFFFNYFFSLNVQSIFASLLLIIYTSSTIFTFSLIKFSNRKNRRCKHFITFAIFTEIFWRVFRGWRLLNIVTKSYLSYMWQYFWICLTQELHKE